MSKLDDVQADPRFAGFDAPTQAKILAKARAADVTAGLRPPLGQQIPMPPQSGLPPPAPITMPPQSGLPGAPTGPPLPRAPGWMQTAEEGARLVGMGLGGTAMAPVAGALTAGGVTAPLAPVAEATGMGAGAAATDLQIKGLHKALGYAPPETSVVGEALSGALAKPFGWAVGKTAGLAKRGGEWLLYLPQTKAAREAATETIQHALTTKLPLLHDSMHELLLKGREGITRRAEKLEKQLRRLFVGEQQTVFDDLIHTAPEEAARTVAEMGGAEARGGPLDMLRSMALLRRQVRGTFQGLYNRIQGAISNEYEQVRGPHMNTVVSSEVGQTLASDLRRIKAKAESFAKLPSGLQQHVDDMIAMGEGKPPPQALNVGYGGDVSQFPKDAQKQIQSANEQLLKDIGWAEKNPLTVGKLYGDKSTLGNWMESGSGSARHVADAVRNAIAKAVPESAELNEMNHLWRSLFNLPTLKQLWRGVVPADFNRLFQTKLFPLLVNSANPEEKDILKWMVGTWARNQPDMNFSKFIRQFPPNVIERLYGPGEAQASRILEIGAKTAQLDRLLEASPALERIGNQKVRQEEKRAVELFHMGTKKRLVAFLGSLGEPAKDLQDAVAQMSPAEARHFYVTQMQRPEFAEKLLGIAESQIPLPHVKGAKDIIRYVGYRTVPVGLGELAARGKLGIYAAGTAIGSSAQLFRQAVAHAFISSLEDGRLGEFSRFLDKPKSQAFLNYVAKYGGQSIAYEGLRHMMNPDPPPEPRTRVAVPGPIQGGRVPMLPQPPTPPPTQTPAPTATPGPQSRAPLQQALQSLPSQPQAQAELTRLNVSVPQQTKIQAGGKALEMPREVAQKYHQVRMNLIEQQLSAFMKHAPYQQASSETQRRIVQKMVSKMGRIAQHQLRSDFGRVIREEIAKAPEAPDPSGP